MPTSLQGIAEKAQSQKRYRFRNLYGMLNEELRKEGWREIKTHAAYGVDQSSAQDPGAVTFNDVGTHVASLTILDSSGANDPSPPTRAVNVVPEPGFVQGLGAVIALVAVLGRLRRSGLVYRF